MDLGRMLMVWGCVFPLVPYASLFLSLQFFGYVGASEAKRSEAVLIYLLVFVRSCWTLLLHASQLFTNISALPVPMLRQVSVLAPFCSLSPRWFPCWCLLVPKRPLRACYQPRITFFAHKKTLWACYQPRITFWAHKKAPAGMLSA